MAEEEKLFNNFKSVSAKEWEEVIMNDLKGRDYNRSLIWNTYDGFKVLPYYRRENIRGLAFLNSMPGEYPFLRGINKNGNRWLIRQDIVADSILTANAKAKELLNRGVDSIGFKFQSDKLITESSLTELLKDICLTDLEINLISPPEKCKYALVFRDYLSGRQYEKNLIRGSISADPLGSFLLNGKINYTAIEELADVISNISDLPHFKVITVDGTSYANSGATIVQEIAFSLAQGVEYLIFFTDKGFKADDIAGKLKFNFGIGGSYFPEIAKLRAARILWAEIVSSFGNKDKNSAKLITHSVTNLINKTIYDPWVNMLRTQTEAMSAALGGTCSITVHPYDVVTGVPCEFSERIARNQQLLLREEACFDKVADPGGGSYYIESLTASIAEAAWDIFLKVEEEGGFLESLKKGFIQSEIDFSVKERIKKYSLRKDNILGVTQYADKSENISDKPVKSLLKTDPGLWEEVEIKRLKLFRYAGLFEELRHKTDVYSIENERPVIFILPVGDPVLRMARARFSSNFFAVAGFKIVDNNGFKSVEDGIKAARVQGADMIILCSSDEEYSKAAPRAGKLLENEILVIAGNPLCRSELEKKGIINFIHTGSNILEELSRYQNLLIR